MANIFRYDTIRVEEGTLSQCKWNTMFNLIFFIFLIVPFEAGNLHSFNIPKLCNDGNIKVWVDIGVARRGVRFLEFGIV